MNSEIVSKEGFTEGSEGQIFPRAKAEERKNAIKKGFCFICKEEGHRTNQCTQKKSKATKKTEDDKKGKRVKRLEFEAFYNTRTRYDWRM